MFSGSNLYIQGNTSNNTSGNTTSQEPETTDFAPVWLAAHWPGKLKKDAVLKFVIQQYIDKILDPRFPATLRVRSLLLAGIVHIYERKVRYLYDEANRIRSQTILSIRKATTAGVTGQGVGQGPTTTTTTLGTGVVTTTADGLGPTTTQTTIGPDGLPISTTTHPHMLQLSRTDGIDRNLLSSAAFQGGMGGFPEEIDNQHILHRLTNMLDPQARLDFSDLNFNTGIGADPKTIQALVSMNPLYRDQETSKVASFLNEAIEKRLQQAQRQGQTVDQIESTGLPSSMGISPDLFNLEQFGDLSKMTNIFPDLAGFGDLSNIPSELHDLLTARTFLESNLGTDVGAAAGTGIGAGAGVSLDDLLRQDILSSSQSAQISTAFQNTDFAQFSEQFRQPGEMQDTSDFNLSMQFARNQQLQQQQQQQQQQLRQRGLMTHPLQMHPMYGSGVSLDESIDQSLSFDQFSYGPDGSIQIRNHDGTVTTIPPGSYTIQPPSTTTTTTDITATLEHIPRESGIPTSTVSPLTPTSPLTPISPISPHLEPSIPSISAPSGDITGRGFDSFYSRDLNLTVEQARALAMSGIQIHPPGQFPGQLPGQFGAPFGGFMDQFKGLADMSGVPALPLDQNLQQQQGMYPYQFHVPHGIIHGVDDIDFTGFQIPGLTTTGMGQGFEDMDLSSLHSLNINQPSQPGSQVPSGPTSQVPSGHHSPFGFPSTTAIPTSTAASLTSRSHLFSDVPEGGDLISNLGSIDNLANLQSLASTGFGGIMEEELLNMASLASTTSATIAAAAAETQRLRELASGAAPLASRRRLRRAEAASADNILPRDTSIEFSLEYTAQRQTEHSDTFLPGINRRRRTILSDLNAVEFIDDDIAFAIGTAIPRGGIEEGVEGEEGEGEEEGEEFDEFDRQLHEIDSDNLLGQRLYRRTPIARQKRQRIMTLNSVGSIRQTEISGTSITSSFPGEVPIPVLPTGGLDILTMLRRPRLARVPLGAVSDSATLFSSIYNSTTDSLPTSYASAGSGVVAAAAAAAEAAEEAGGKPGLDTTATASTTPAASAAMLSLSLRVLSLVGEQPADYGIAATPHPLFKDACVTQLSDRIRGRISASGSRQSRLGSTIQTPRSGTHTPTIDQTSGILGDLTDIPFDEDMNIFGTQDQALVQGLEAGLPGAPGAPTTDTTTPSTGTDTVDLSNTTLHHYEEFDLVNISPADLASFGLEEFEPFLSEVAAVQAAQLQTQQALLLQQGQEQGQDIQEAQRQRQSGLEGFDLDIDLDLDLGLGTIGSGLTGIDEEKHFASRDLLLNQAQYDRDHSLFGGLHGDISPLVRAAAIATGATTIDGHDITITPTTTTGIDTTTGALISDEISTTTGTTADMHDTFISGATTTAGGEIPSWAIPLTSGKEGIIIFQEAIIDFIHELESLSKDAYRAEVEIRIRKFAIHALQRGATREWLLQYKKILLQKYSSTETTCRAASIAFTALLHMLCENKIIATQKRPFGDIIISRKMATATESNVDGVNVDDDVDVDEYFNVMDTGIKSTLTPRKRNRLESDDDDQDDIIE